MRERIVGILGGMGPEATVDLFREIIRLTPAKKDQDHIPLLIYSNPEIPDRTAAIMEGGKDPLPALVKSARTLESAGAGIIAMPCNTAHYYLPQLEREVSIPILNMIRETLCEFQELMPGAGTVGLLATSGTVRSGIYHRIFGAGGVEVIAPENGAQEEVSSAIRQIKAGSRDRRTSEVLEAIGSGMIASGARAVILGCTEIPLALDPGDVHYPCLNPTRILAQAAVDWALGKRQEAAR